jgi:hypothetical protein
MRSYGAVVPCRASSEVLVETYRRFGGDAKLEILYFSLTS